MSVLKLETWDSVVAPAVPSGWTLTSSTFETTVSGANISAPNMFALSNSAVAGTNYYATWGTPDGNSGNVVVQAYVYFTNVIGGGPGSGNVWKVLCRGSSSTLSDATTQYEAIITTDTVAGPKDSLEIGKRVAGSYTRIGSNVLLIGSDRFQANAWYLLQLSAATSSSTYLQLSVQRYSDGAWYFPGLGWVTSKQFVAVTVSDTAISGSGYAGFAGSQGAASQGMYSDNWELDTVDSVYSPLTGYRLQPVARNHVPRLWV